MSEFRRFCIGTLVGVVVAAVLLDPHAVNATTGMAFISLTCGVAAVAIFGRRQ